MIHAFQNAVAYLCFSALAVIACVCVFVGFCQVGRWLRANLCPISLVLFATAAVIATCEAQKRGGGGGSGASAQPIVHSILGAETNAKWRAHGAFEDVFYLPASNWWARMPGGGWIDRLRIRSSGGFQAKGASGGPWTNYPPPFAQKLSLAPEANWPLPSLFWHATTPSNTVVMTWSGGLYARSHTNQVDLQVELFNDGSFDYRYADHAEHFSASLPFDLDGDGLENSVDPEPETAGPDAHGTNAEWYNTVCSNVLEAVATSCDPPGSGAGGTQLVASVELAWRAGVNSNAYYFVDVVTERGPAPIYFTGDRASRLGNPVVVARAFETNRVPLLIGVDYSITSDAPFTVSFPVDYMYPEVVTNGVADYNVRWPLNFVFTESIGASNRVYTVTVEPYDPGGVLEWDGNVPMRGGTGGDCACVHYGSYSASFTCSSTCTCGGGCRARGRYLFEVAEFALVGGECRCGFDDPPNEEYWVPHEPNDGPSLTISFSNSAVIFEDAYEDRPGVTMPRRSTRVRLTIDAYGGPDGGSLWLTGANLGNLVPVDGGVSLPYSQALAAGESYHATGVYEGEMESGEEGDVSVSGTFLSNVTAQQLSTGDNLTVVKVELRPEKRAPENPCVNRHVYGVDESVNCLQQPSSPQVQWVSTADGVVSNSFPMCYICPIHAEQGGLSARVGTALLPLQINVIEPSEVVCTAYGFLPADILTGIGLALELKLKPFNVSFEGLRFQEVAAPPAATSPTWGIHGAPSEARQN